VVDNRHLGGFQTRMKAIMRTRPTRLAGYVMAFLAVLLCDIWLLNLRWNFEWYFRAATGGAITFRRGWATIGYSPRFVWHRPGYYKTASLLDNDALGYVVDLSSWNNWTIQIPIWNIIILLLFIAAVLIFVNNAPISWQCKRCKYDLRGSKPSAQGVLLCPECGQRVWNGASGE
jgi:hypothetical protein